MGNENSLIGKYIISKESGIGEIIDVAPLQEGGEMFYKVTFPNENCTNYFSMNNQQHYRVLSSEDTINDAIKIFKKNHEAPVYSTTQEMINSQKEALNESDICLLAKSLSILSKEKNLHAQVSKPYKMTIKTFVDEISFVLGQKSAEIYKVLGVKEPRIKASK